MSSFEPVKGFAKPVDSSCRPQTTQSELIHAHDMLKAKRKLTLILRSKSNKEPVVRAGDLVQVYVKHRKEKRGKWLSSRSVLSFDQSDGIVLVWMVAPSQSLLRIFEMPSMENTSPKTSKNRMINSISVLMNHWTQQVSVILIMCRPGVMKILSIMIYSQYLISEMMLCLFLLSATRLMSYGRWKICFTLELRQRYSCCQLQ